MLDIFKYSSLELRKQEGQCIPRGPSFERAKIEEIRLPMCTIAFRAPRHSPSRRHDLEQYGVRARYDLERTKSIGSVFVPSDSWQEVDICWRRWAFYGPWFTGYKGDVGIAIHALGTKTVNPGVNFLYPAALEVAIQGYLTSFYGHKIYNKLKLTPYYRAPVNWTPVNGLPVPAVQFDVEETSSYIQRYRYVCFPVARDRLLIIRLDYEQSCTGNWADKDAKISPEPMLDLINNIISSITLIPTPELQAEIDQAKVACKGKYSVSPKCQPFKWPADVDTDGLTILDYKKDRYKTG